MLTLEEVKNDAAIRTYIQRADESLIASGLYGAQFSPCDHGGADGRLYSRNPEVSARTVEVARIAGYLHDIGIWSTVNLPVRSCEAFRLLVI